MIDTVVERVREDLLQRSQKGINKYGVTLDRTDLNMKQWLQHAYEECLDQANYLKRCIVELEEKESKTAIWMTEEKKKDQAWEDFREGAYNAWKKQQEGKEIGNNEYNSKYKEIHERMTNTPGVLDSSGIPY